MKRILIFAICLFALISCSCREEPALKYRPEIVTPSPEKPGEITYSPPVKSQSNFEAEKPVLCERVTLLAAGDLLCLGGQLSTAKAGIAYDFDYCFEKVRDEISKADIAIANLETLIADGYPYTAIKPSPADPPPEIEEQQPNAADPIKARAEGGAAGDLDCPCSLSGTFLLAKPYPKAGAAQPLSSAPRINGPESFLAAAVNAGFDVLTTANNHIYDYQAEGLIKTLEMLDRYNVLHTGAFGEPGERVPLIVKAKGFSVAIFAYTDILNKKPEKDFAYMVNRYDEAAIKADIEQARAAGADFVIVSMHWGIEHTHKPLKSQRNMAKYIAGAGADLIIGAHPHCMQPVELIETDRGSVPVFYSLGNFLSSMPDLIHKDGAMIKIVLEKDSGSGSTKIIEMSYVPTHCFITDEDNFTILPADSASVSQSPYSSRLQKARERITKVLGDAVCRPE
ncbi:MAG: Capsule biosynthesis protein CapA [Firmicutes bacterium ADurb.Bin182]|nr:MAG: Capsule biosynthesis protein CapA [Firmicutes bacterium ADurb.Bin182]